MKIAIIGAGGHARVVYEILRHDKNMEVVAFVDNVTKGSDEKIMSIPVVGDHSVLAKLIKDGTKGFIVGVGDNKIRAHYFKEIINMGLDPINAVHPTAHIAYNARIAKGVVVATGATIATGAVIGNNSIVNTGAIIEHEDIIEEHVHIGPGTSIAGRVTVKKGAFVGIGCTVKGYVTIGKKAVIGAGSVVLEDIPNNAVAVGAPAKVIKIKNEDERIKK